MPVRTSYDHLTPPQRPRRGRGWSVVGIVLLVVVAVIAGYGLSRHNDKGAATTSSTTSPVASSSAATPTPSSNAPTSVAVGGQVVPGLWAGTATVLSGAKDSIQGIPIGWPQTTDGAIGAAMVYIQHAMDPVNMVDATAEKINLRIYTKEGLRLAAYTPQQLGELRKGLHLSPTAAPLDAHGKPDRNLTYVAGGEAVYGAYKVASVATSVTGAPTTVKLRVMVPAWRGIANKGDLRNVKLYFRGIDMVMQWAQGADGSPLDWRIQDTPDALPYTPPTQGVSNIGYAALAKMLGDGWCVPADSTDKPVHGAVFAR